MEQEEQEKKKKKGLLGRADDFIQQKQDEKNEGEFGRSGIDSRQRVGSYSKRCADGTIDVVKKFCPECAHHKCFVKPRGTFCTRCKHKF